MSLRPYWWRHFRNLAYRDDPFSVFGRDPFQVMRQMLHPVDHGIVGVYTDSEVKVDDKKVEVCLDVQNFTPEEIHVKTVGNEITVEGKREVKKKDGWTRSHFERRFLLPEGFPPERVECHLDKGTLKLIAFRAEPEAERNVPIQEKTSEESSKK